MSLKQVAGIALLLFLLPAYADAQLPKLPRIKNKTVNDVIDVFKKPSSRTEKTEEGTKTQKRTGVFAKKGENYADINSEELNGKWLGTLELNPGRTIEFEMRITATGNNLSAIADYNTAYGKMKYLLEGKIENGQIEFFEKEVLEQGPGKDILILYKKKYAGGCNYVNNKWRLTGKYEPDGQFYYKDKIATPTETRIFGSTFRLLKVDEEKIAREFGQYVYTTDKDQDEYLRRMMIYFADNKYYNYSRKCTPATFRYYILSRDENGMFTKVLGKYHEETKEGERVIRPDSMEILVQFDKGMPYRIGYPLAESLPEVTPMHKGELGALEYPDDAKKRAIELFLAENKKRDLIFEENRKKSQAAIEKKLLAYGKVDCKTCFQESTTDRTGKYEYTDWDEKGHPFTVEKTMNITTIHYTNKCTQTITVIGVQRIGTTNKGPYYEDISFSLKPGQVISFDRGGIGQMLGVFVQITSLDGEINPEYSRQYLRIVGKGKAVIK